MQDAPVVQDYRIIGIQLQGAVESCQCAFLVGRQVVGKGGKGKQDIRNEKQEGWNSTASNHDAPSQYGPLQVGGATPDR